MLQGDQACTRMGPRAPVLGPGVRRVWFAQPGVFYLSPPFGGLVLVVAGRLAVTFLNEAFAVVF